MRKSTVTILLLIFFAVLLYFYKISVSAYYTKDNYIVELISDTKEIVFQEQEDYVNVNVTIKNKTRNVISSQDDVFLSYHLLDSEGNTLTWDFPRSYIDAIDPFDQAIIPVTVERPAEPGKYIIEIDVVVEGKYWLKERSERSLVIEMESI